MRNEIINKLKNFARDLKVDKLDIVVIGGSALIITGKIDRHTHDVDSFIKQDNKFVTYEQLQLNDLAWEYTLNSHAEAFGINLFLEFEDQFKLIEDIKEREIKFYTPSIEFIIFTKIYAGMDRTRDWNDIMFVKDDLKQINFSRLQYFIESWEDKFATKKEVDKFSKHYDEWLEYIHS